MSNTPPEKNMYSFEDEFSSFSKRSFKRLKKQPYILFPGILAYIKGFYYKIKFKVQFKKINIGRHFRVYGRFVITGPGRVTIGDDCFIMSHTIKTVRLRTLLPDSKIAIGNHVGFNGSSLVCRKEIFIDDFCNIADAYITDTPAHPISMDRRLYSASEIEGESVFIGKNVWISVNVVVLKGVRIGDNTVIGACSLITNSLPANILAVGIPAKVVQKIPKSFSSSNS